MNWYDFERLGWSWAVGWNPNYGGYYAQAWRDYSKPVRITGRLHHREIFTEGGRGIEEATAKLWERLEQLERPSDGKNND